MNNGFMFNPFQGYQNYENILNDYDKLLNKIERLEKNIRILENRINIIEKNKPKDISYDEPSDMYMI